MFKKKLYNANVNLALQRSCQSHIIVIILLTSMSRELMSGDINLYYQFSFFLTFGEISDQHDIECMLYGSLDGIDQTVVLRIIIMAELETTYIHKWCMLENGSVICVNVYLSKVYENYYQMLH